MNKNEIIIILILILLEAISLGVCYVWFDELHVMWQFVLTFVNLLWLALLYMHIKKLNKSR